MGACSFIKRGKGKSIQEAYTDLCDYAEQEYGQDMYNGTISTTDGFSDHTAYFKNSKKDYRAYIDENIDKLSKRQCVGICIKPPVENKNKIKSVVTHTVHKGTRKWDLRYVVQTRERTIGSYTTKGTAVEVARQHTEKTQERTTVVVEKVSNMPTEVAKIEYKKSDKESPGEYVFFGWAAE